MTVRDLTRHHMDVVINNLNNNFNADVSVLNWGQLGFALDKPRMSLHGRALYPEMHQKAAVLMETLCKSHTLTDGNKRASVMAAEYLANINGATLVVPLKVARMAVDCAIDADDKMSAEIVAWFKVHIARDEIELAVMLEELVEERDMVSSLLDQRRDKEAEQVADRWLAFDSNPESRQAWSSLVEKWERMDGAQGRDPMSMKAYFSPWLSLGGGLRIGKIPRLPALADGRIANPVYVGHGSEDLERAEEHVKRSVERLRDPSCGAGALWNAGIVLENFGYYKSAVRVYDRLLGMDDTDDVRLVLSHKLVSLAFSGRYTEAHAVVDRLAELSASARL